MKVEEIPVGGRFSQPSFGKTGKVIHQGPSGTMVKWDNSGRIVRIVKQPKWGAKNQEPTVREFEAPGKPELISGAAEVEAL